MTRPGRKLWSLFLLFFLLCACGEQAQSSVSEPAEISPAPTAFDLLAYQNPVKLAAAKRYLDGFSYSVYVDHVSITGYTGRAAEVEIPAEIDGVPVTVVAGTFSDSVRKVTLPEGLKHLSLNSFCSCPGLQRLTLPASLESLFPADSASEQYIDLELAEGNPYFTMEDGVLFDADMETLIYFPRERIGSYTVPDTVTAIGEHAFSCCNVREVILPEGLVELRDGAFECCAQLSSITLPKSLQTLGDAFRACTELEAVEVHPENPDFISMDGVLYSGDMETLLVYPHARTGTDFTVPETVQQGWHLPLFSSHLQTLTIHAGVEPVDFFNPVGLDTALYFEGTAEEWRSLFRRVLPLPRVQLVQEGEEVSYEGEYAYTVENGQATLWGYCGTDTVLEIPNTLGGCPVTAIGEEALCFLSGENWETSENGAFESRVRTYQVTVPEGVVSLGDRAFYGSNLFSISLPSTLLEIGEKAFAFCDTLRTVTVSPENPNFTAVDGALYTKDMTTLVHLSGHALDENAGINNERNEYTLPASVTEILPGAFLGCPYLSTFDVEPGNPAFMGNGGVLTTLDGKTLAAYPAGGVRWEQRQVPETVETIGAYAFARCELPDRTAYLLRNVTALEEGAFAYCVIPVVTIPEGIESLPERAFFGSAFSDYSSSFSKLQLPAGLTSIGEDAFALCTSPETVWFGGTESEWEKISMGSGNEVLETAHVEFSAD